MASGGATWPISVYLMVLAAITFLAARVAPETARNALN
jgi:MFS transporter, MHS family, shikimate and dehydroshikimate transport protein